MKKKRQAGDNLVAFLEKLIRLFIGLVQLLINHTSSNRNIMPLKPTELHRGQKNKTCSETNIEGGSLEVQTKINK